MHEPSPGLLEFDYLKPASLPEASHFLAQHAGEARPLLGGTDTFVRMRDGAWHDKYIVDVKQFEGMTDITFNPETGLRLGAAVSMNSPRGNSRPPNSPAMCGTLPSASACRNTSGRKPSMSIRRICRGVMVVVSG